MDEILTRIRKDLGENAVILHTRTYQRGGVLGLFKKTVIEVTATDSNTTGPAKRSRSSADGDRKSQLVDHASMVKRLAKQKKRALPQQTPMAQPPDRVEKPDRIDVVLPAKQKETPIGRSQSEAPILLKPPVAKPADSLPSNSVTGKGPNQNPPREKAKTTAPAKRAVDSSEQTKHHVARRFIAAPERGTKTEKRSNTRVLKTAETKPVTKRTAMKKSMSIPPKNGQVASATVTKEPTKTASSDANAAQTAQLSRELSSMKQMVSQVLQRQAGSQQTAMPKNLFKYYMTLIENEVAQDIADEICAKVRDELGSEKLKNSEAVRRSVLKHLTQHIPTADDSTSITRTVDGRPLTMALIGPTGVGKTTTVAKLAADFKLRHKRRVGLITTDTYRIAAVDQLRTYANIIGIPLKVALTPTEIASACHELRECDVILIDTAGRSPNDKTKIEEIRGFIDSASPHETHLVLSSTSSQTVCMKAIDQFGPVDFDRIIFTKLDEAVSFGVLVNVAQQVGKRLSFVTTGQEVPDHIETGRSDRLARLVIGESDVKERMQKA